MKLRYAPPWIALLVFISGVVAGALVYRPDKTIRVVTGLAAKTLCSDVFVSGLDPETVYREAVAARPGVERLAQNMHYVVDRARGAVSVDVFGRFVSQAVYRKGLGCMAVIGEGPVDASLPRDSAASRLLQADSAGPATVQASDPRLRAALDSFFIEPAAPPHRWIRAVVVMRKGEVIGERYAPGIGVDTPLAGYSAAKSLISTLVGILVREGRLNVDSPAPVPAWSNPQDARHRITLDNLLRMTSGLSIAQTGSGFDPAARMLYTERDMAGYAESRPLVRAPGVRWDYSDASTLIVSRIVRDAVGGRATDVVEFARRELFDPLGMRTMVIEFDATGTPVGSTAVLGSARDWARLGSLYAHNGVVNGRRILPAGWAGYSATPTLDTDYGAGFWTNAGDAPAAAGRMRAGMPRDALFASGTMGQRVYVMPTQDVVIVRLGVTQQWPDFDILGDLGLIRVVLGGHS